MTRSDFEAALGLHKALGASLCCVYGQKERLPFNTLPGLKVPSDSAFDLHFLPEEGIGQKCEELDPKTNI